MKDIAAEADCERNLINQKLLLSVFKSMGAYSKYATEMFVSITQIECTLHNISLKNSNGAFLLTGEVHGAGKNIKDDLAQEIDNRLSKSIVQRMGPHKTIQLISEVCKATNGIAVVKEQFDDSVAIQKSSV